MSGEQSGSLGEIAKQQAEPKGKKSRSPQGSGGHLPEARQPPLHGLGKEDIGNRFQNKNQAEDCNKKFHGRILPAARRLFKAGTHLGLKIHPAIYQCLCLGCFSRRSGVLLGCAIGKKKRREIRRNQGHSPLLISTVSVFWHRAAQSVSRGLLSVWRKRMRLASQGAAAKVVCRSGVRLSRR